ncbi:SusC/RagA family TonB-linked outer membrane protein [Alistipes sp.]|uniref:SusC/RagA family TonB-linked outer membrane protein n=1 Tax=Alistipes sp. TaxID=1872444 RepID=UPI0023F4CE6B|nr:TonB-dependent receptor [Alistipes sp.]
MLKNPFSVIGIIILLSTGTVCIPLWGYAAANGSSQTSAQTKTSTIKGRVIDAEGMPLVGAVIQVQGKAGGVIASSNGVFEIEAAPEDVLVASFLGMENASVTVGAQLEITIVMQQKSSTLENVTIVAFSRQKKESVVGSITTVKPSELKVASSNLTTAFAGRVPGMMSYRSSGEPGRDNAEFFIRGVTTFGYRKSPLMLVDGMEISADDLARLQTDDIESFSIMKDAIATSLYGARGANGVILITTKEGREGPARVSVRIENTWSMPTRMIDIADPITYMRLNNEAVSTRNPLGILPYSEAKIAATMNPNRNPYVYPAVDWIEEMFKPAAMNQRVNFNISGGGKVARYYLAATFNQDNGLMRNEGMNNFNTNIDLKKYNVRTNFNVNVTKTTEVAFKFQGNFDDYRGPIEAGNILFDYAVHASPVDYPKIFAPDEGHRSMSHPLYGNTDGANHINPYALMSRGYKDYSRTLVLAQVDINQDLKFITEGLRVRGLLSTTRYSYFDSARSYKPFYYKIGYYNPELDVYNLTALNAESGSEYLDYSGGKDINSKTYLEAAVEYARTFGRHEVTGLLVYQNTQQVIGNPSSVLESLPFRNQGLSGRFTYTFDKRYGVELNFGYNGSERFARHERYGFFPAAGVTWNISSEPFWRGVAKVIDKLRLKATYGLVGNDAISSNRFFYLSDVNMNDTGKNVWYGTDFNVIRPGITVRRYSNNDITWEIARKLNLGFEMRLFDKVELQVDYFTENRSNILLERTNLPSSMGLEASVEANVGRAKSHGVEGALTYQHSFSEDFWLSANANFTYATSEFLVADEPDYAASGLPWRSRIGYSLNQQWGYIAERLFIDETDIANSPIQTFGPYMPGDIKYKDINRDGKIDESDLVPIGYPTEAEINYGFGATLGYKGFDFSFFFNGLGRKTFFIDAQQMAPFNNPPVTAAGVGGYTRKTALFKEFADSHWSESNPDIYAVWPRLSTDAYDNSNNYQQSTWWMRNGSFLRLKLIELGYTLPHNLTRKIRIEDLRIYVSGEDLFAGSNFKMWDVEMGGMGIGYPIQKKFNIGLQVKF